MTRSVPTLRNDQRLDLCRLDSLRAKLNALSASAHEALADHQNGKVGNIAFDVETLAHEIGKVGSRLLVASSEIETLNHEAAQRHAERVHGPLIETLREIIEVGHRPALRLVEREEA